MVRVGVASMIIAALLAAAPLSAVGGFQGLRISTPFPSQSARLGEPITMTLTVKNFGLPPQTVSLRVQSAPRGWTATFLGAGRVIESVFVDPDQESSVTLRLEPPKGTRAGGEYRLQVLAAGQSASRRESSTSVRQTGRTLHAVGSCLDRDGKLLHVFPSDEGKSNHLGGR